MYVLAVEYQRSSDFSSNTYKDLKVGLDSALKKPLPKQSIWQGARPLLRFGWHPRSVDALLVSWWYQSEQDVSLVVPPPQMVQNVKVGNMETFCVGEPWPAQTVTQGIATQPSQLVNSGKTIQRKL